MSRSRSGGQAAALFLLNFHHNSTAGISHCGLRIARTRDFTTCGKSLRNPLDDRLEAVDSTVFEIIQKEKRRQERFIHLIPSANFTSQSVLSAVGSVLQNPNSEGYPGTRYYPGTEYLDEAELLCQKRALEAFGLDEQEWGVNVQSHSGPLAILQASSAFLAPHGRILLLNIPHGSFLSKYYETISYSSPVSSSSPIDYDSLERVANAYRPSIILASTPASPYLTDYARLHSIATNVSGRLITDISDLAGLVATNCIPSPFLQSSIVTTATQSSLRGPPGALIFFRKALSVPRVDLTGVEETWSLASAVNSSVFPRHQGGPHNHAISGIAVALGQVLMPQFRAYQSCVLDNARALAESLHELGHVVEGDGRTENHLVVLRLACEGVNAVRVRNVLARVGVASRIGPNADELHFGAAAMTTRGFMTGDFRRLAGIVHRAVGSTRELEGVAEEGQKGPDIVGLEREVQDLVGAYGVPRETDMPESSS